MLLLPLLLTAAVGPTIALVLQPQASRQGPGGSPTAAAERMLGGTVRRGNTGFRVVRLPRYARGGCSSTSDGNVYEVTLYDTPNEWEEVFILGVPLFPEAELSPLLMGFHQFEAGEQDFCLNTGFFGEAFSRGWYVVAPLGAVQYNFGYPEAQDNTELVLDFCMAYLGHAIDSDRIYGVGFSMGGGWVSSQAARHQDASRSRFAAIVNHTGGVDLAHIYSQSANDDDDPPYDIPDYLDALFNGPPEGPNLFAYQRCSLIWLTPTSPLATPGLPPVAWPLAPLGPPWTVDSDTDMGRNLHHVPQRLAYATGDNSPAGIVNREQIDLLETHLLELVPPAPVELVTHAGNQHRWDTLDEVIVCDYLALKTLADPSGNVTTTADRDGRWYDMEVTQEAPGTFTRWTWYSDPDDVNNQWFALFSTKNLDTLKLHSADAGFATDVNDRTIKVTLLKAAGLDAQSDEVVLTDFSVEPAVDIAGSETPVFGVDYDWDSTTRELTLFARDWPPGSNPIDWIITP
jgi:hypothetical protein